MPRIKKETLKTVLLCTITFIGYFLGISLFIQSNSLFLDTLGAENLPYAIITSAVIIISFSLIASYLSSKINEGRLLMLGLALIAGSYFLSSTLPYHSIVQVVIFYLVTDFFYGFLDTALINFSSSLLTPLRAKNILPVINGFNSLGLIIGSYFAIQVQSFHEEAGFGTLPAVAILIVIAIVFVTQKMFAGQISQRVKQKQPAKNFKKTIKESLDYIFKESRLFRMVALIAFIMVGVTQFSDFKLETTLSLNFSGDDLVAMFSMVYLIESAITFFLNLFISNRLLFRYGIGNMIIFLPVIAATFLAVATIGGFTPWAVILYYLAFALPKYSYFPIAFVQLFQIIPKKLNQSVYFLIQGLITSVGTLFFALSLLVYSYNITLEKTLNTGVLFFLLAGLIVAVYKMRKLYIRNLKENLFKDDTYLKHQSIELLAEKSNKKTGVLYLRRLLELPHESTETKQKITSSLGIIGSYESLPDLMDLLKSKDAKENYSAILAIKKILRQKKIDQFPITKYVLLQALEEIFTTDAAQYIKEEVIETMGYFQMEDVVAFLDQELKEKNPDIQMNIIETFAGFKDRGIIRFIQPYIDYQDKKVRAAAIVALWQFSDRRPYLLSRVADILNGSTDQDIETGLYVIAETNATWEKSYVQRQLQSQNEKIRLYALFVMTKLWGTGTVPQLVAELGNIIQKNEKGTIEFGLSQLIKAKPVHKEAIIKEIRQQDPRLANAFIQSFQTSRYILDDELEQLT